MTDVSILFEFTQAQGGEFSCKSNRTVDGESAAIALAGVYLSVVVCAFSISSRVP
jgi:hypothetical protein